MFLRRARALERNSAPPTPPTRPQPSTPFLVKLFGRNVSQADKDAAKARVKQVAGTALSLLKESAALAQDAAGDAAVPGLSIGLQALATVLEMIETMGDTVEGVQALCERIVPLSSVVKNLCTRAENHTLPEGMPEKIADVVQTWKDIGERAEKIRSRTRFVRFIASKKDAKTLEGLVADINTSIQDKIMIPGILNIEIAVEGTRQDIGAVHKSVKAIAILLEDSFMPIYAKKAQYDAGDTVRHSCLDGTRVDLLDQFREWITAACTQKDFRLKNGSVLWINGLAGTGKTTIAHSLASWARQQLLLGASFFCSRFDPECSNPTFVFVTVARQLCSFHEPFKHKVTEALRKNPGVASSGAANQFEKLIVEPLEALEEPFPPCVLVFDALDECRNEASAFPNAASTIMTVVAKFIPRVERFLTFVFTSRPEPTITPLFNGPRAETPLESKTKSVVLHTIELALVEGDIRIYLVDGFRQIREAYTVPADWPSPRDVETLVRLANGLFIFVSTAIAFMMATSSRDPQSRLQKLAAIDMSDRPSTTILNQLYSKIVTSSYAGMESELAENLQKVLSAIALTQEPLSVSSLASLTGFAENSISNVLSGLHSVLHIPDNCLDPILVIHPTFPEFVLRAPEPESTGATSPPAGTLFYVQPAQHWSMFSRCLDAMSSLRRDMVNIRYPAKFKSEIVGFRELTRRVIPPHVRYACRNWTQHLCDGRTDPTKIDVAHRFRGFVYKQILFWLEACILLEIPTGPALAAASDACRALGDAFADLAPLLTNCRRFMQTYSLAMHMAPLQLYHFALSLAPTSSSFKDLYAQELEHSIVVRHGAPSRWPPSLDRFVGHGGEQVYSVAFSSNGSCFASGGGDHRVRIWDTAARTELQSFDGHTDDVKCAAFSPGGAHVASGSDDMTVCIRQVSSGARVHTLEGHADEVFFVAYSADGRRLLSATRYDEVKLWDTTDGRCVFALERTWNWTWQVALSPNGSVIARGEGASLVLHDVSSATHEALSLPDEVQACAFSPDGRYVAARTEHAIRVWATADKALVRSIDMPDSTFTSRLAFSHDGKYIACGSWSGAVYVWEVASQGSPHILNGHTEVVWDVAWSPDGLQLASATSDGTIRLWDGALHSSTAEAPAASAHRPAPAGLPRFALIQHNGSETLLHLPYLSIDDFPAIPRLPSGAPTVTTFTDVVAACDAALQSDDDLSSSSDSARSWVFLTGQQRPELDGHLVAISRDGSRLSYPSPTSDEVVDVCDLRSGIVVATLSGHTEDVCSIAFSPDSTRLATGSEDEAVKVWDATTGALICGHAEHQGLVCATAFSSDGRLVASGSFDETVRVFDVAAERVVNVLGLHSDSVMELMFAVDDGHIVALDDSSRVTIWKVATEARIHSFSFDTHDWRRSLTFSSNTVGIRVNSDAGPRTIGLWKPRTGQGRFVVFGEWVYARFRETVHRLCWIPPEWRTVLDSDGETLRLAERKSDGHPHGRLIVIDMSRILAYVDSLGPDSS